MRFVKFPDGTEVRAASLRDRVEHDNWRQLGLYMDEGWLPSWESTVIQWQDFGLPYSNAEAFDQILAAFKRAKSGQHLEVGCLGGLGRTGTVLSCMAVLAGVPPPRAVAWVRENYDRRAVENDDQQQWVLWFADEIKRRVPSN